MGGNPPIDLVRPDGAPQRCRPSDWRNSPPFLALGAEVPETSRSAIEALASLMRTPTLEA
jgi:hypothetical protein